jgi:hypothetical protein
MIFFRHYYIGELRPGGSLKELSGLVETQLKGSNLYVGEVIPETVGSPEELERTPAFRANVAFLMGQEPSINFVANLLSKRKAPTAIIAFDSPLSADDMFLTLHSADRTEFLEEFKKEADFIGYFVLRRNIPEGTLYKRH